MKVSRLFLLLSSIFSFGVMAQASNTEIKMRDVSAVHSEIQGIWRCDESTVTPPIISKTETVWTIGREETTDIGSTFIYLLNNTDQYSSGEIVGTSIDRYKLISSTDLIWTPVSSNQRLTNLSKGSQSKFVKEIFEQYQTNTKNSILAQEQNHSKILRLDKHQLILVDYATDDLVEIIRHRTCKR